MKTSFKPFQSVLLVLLFALFIGNSGYAAPDPKKPVDTNVAQQPAPAQEPQSRTIYDVINTVIAGGLLGALGQSIRMAVGLKKLSDVNQTKALNEKEGINTARLLISLAFGFAAGALFLIIKGTTDIGKQEFIFSIIAAGYAGTDFIEGFFNTYISKIDPNSKPAAQAAPLSPATDIPIPQSFAGNERDDEPTTNL